MHVNDRCYLLSTNKSVSSLQGDGFLIRDGISKAWVLSDSGFPLRKNDHVSDLLSAGQLPADLHLSRTCCFFILNLADQLRRGQALLSRHALKIWLLRWY